MSSFSVCLMKNTERLVQSTRKDFVDAAEIVVDLVVRCFHQDLDVAVVEVLKRFHRARA